MERAHPAKRATRRCLAAPSALLLALAACASPVVARDAPPLSTQGWVLLPLMNYSETPHAAEAAQAILSTLLH